MIDLSVLVTESRNKETMGLDQMTLWKLLPS